MNISSNISSISNTNLVGYTLTPSKALEKALEKKSAECAKKNIESVQTQKDSLTIPLNQKVAFGLSMLSLAGSAYSYAGGSPFPAQSLGIMFQAATAYSLVQNFYKGPFTQTAFTLASMGLTFTPLKPLVLGMFTYNMLTDSYKQAKKAISLRTEDNNLTVARNLFVYTTNSLLSSYNLLQSIPSLTSSETPVKIPVETPPASLPTTQPNLPSSEIPVNVESGFQPTSKPLPNFPFSEKIEEVPVYSASYFQPSNTSYVQPTCSAPGSKITWLFKNKPEYQKIIQPVLNTALNEVNKEQLNSASPILSESRTFMDLQKLISGGSVFGGNKPIYQSIVHKGFSKLLPPLQKISGYEDFKWSRNDIALFVKEALLDPITTMVSSKKALVTSALSQDHLRHVENEYTSQIRELESRIWDLIPKHQKA